MPKYDISTDLSNPDGVLMDIFHKLQANGLITDGKYAYDNNQHHIAFETPLRSEAIKIWRGNWPGDLIVSTGKLVEYENINTGESGWKFMARGTVAEVQQQTGIPTRIVLHIDEGDCKEYFSIYWMRSESVPSMLYCGKMTSPQNDAFKHIDKMNLWNNEDVHDNLNSVYYHVEDNNGHAEVYLHYYNSNSSQWQSSNSPDEMFVDRDRIFYIDELSQFSDDPITDTYNDVIEEPEFLFCYWDGSASHWATSLTPFDDIANDYNGNVYFDGSKYFYYYNNGTQNNKGRWYTSDQMSSVFFYPHYRGIRLFDPGVIVCNAVVEQRQILRNNQICTTPIDATLADHRYIGTLAGIDNACTPTSVAGLVELDGYDLIRLNPFDTENTAGHEKNTTIRLVY